MKEHNRPGERPPRHRTVLLIASALLLTMIGVGQEAAEEPWSVEDIQGKTWTVSGDEANIVLLFFMTDQENSRYAAQQIEEMTDGHGSIRVAVVISGTDAPVRARSLAETPEWALPVIADPDYAVSGRFSVRVWPTTIVIGRDGEQIGRIAGLPKSFSKDIAAYIDFADGKIDADAMKERLTSHDVVASTPARVAARHVQLAERLVLRGQVDLAQREAHKALEVDPGNGRAKLALARTHVLQDDPSEALSLLGEQTFADVPAWRVNTLRGRILVELERWEEARDVLTEALKINADPAEALYYMARVHAQADEWEEAAKAYRRAFEHTSAARAMLGRRK